MTRPRYRVIVKIACDECTLAISTKKKIDIACAKCEFKKWNNVTNLLTFTSFLNEKHYNWIWFNVFEYKKDAHGRKLCSFQKGKNEPNSISLS